MNKLHFLLSLFLTLLLFGCGFLGNNPNPIKPAEDTVDIAIDRVIRSGEFEERVETEVLPQNNCENKSSISFSVSRERTLEQSIDLTLKSEGGGEIELAGKPLEVGASGKIMAAIGAEYGHNSGKSISDLGGMEFTVEPGDFPVYTIVWREKWEKGYVTIQHNDEEIEVPYYYLTTARPELIDVEYRSCSSEELSQEQSQELTTPVLTLPTDTPAKPPTVAPTYLSSTNVVATEKCKEFGGTPLVRNSITSQQVEAWRQIGSTDRTTAGRVIYCEIHQVPNPIGFTEGDYIPSGVIITADLGFNWDSTYPGSLERLVHDGGGWGVFLSLNPFVVRRADDLPNDVGGQYWFVSQ